MPPNIPDPLDWLRWVTNTIAIAALLFLVFVAFVVSPALGACVTQAAYVEHLGAYPIAEERMEPLLTLWNQNEQRRIQQNPFVRQQPRPMPGSTAAIVPSRGDLTVTWFSADGCSVARRDLPRKDVENAIRHFLGQAA